MPADAAAVATGVAAAALWDARMTYDVGRLIQRLMTWCPPPPGSEVAPDLELWAAELCENGEARLEELGVRRLRAV